MQDISGQGSVWALGGSQVMVHVTEYDGCELLQNDYHTSTEHSPCYALDVIPTPTSIQSNSLQRLISMNNKNVLICCYDRGLPIVDYLGRLARVYIAHVPSLIGVCSESTYPDLDHPRFGPFFTPKTAGNGVVLLHDITCNIT